MYRNEAEVGAAVRASGLPRSEVFISVYNTNIPFCFTQLLIQSLYLATKCVSKTHGYESTKKGVDASLSKMQFGAYKTSQIMTDMMKLIRIDYLLA